MLPQMTDHAGARGSLGADGVKRPDLASYNVDESLTGTNYGKLTEMTLGSNSGHRSSCFLNSTDMHSTNQKKMQKK
jgi:hypothetical protein